MRRRASFFELVIVFHPSWPGTVGTYRFISTLVGLCLLAALGSVPNLSTHGNEREKLAMSLTSCVNISERFWYSSCLWQQ